MAIAAPLLRRRCRRGAGVVLTPAKLNLFLEVEGRRPDGFHDLTTLMVPILWQDHLRISLRSGADDDHLISTGVEVPTGVENLVRRAADAIRVIREVPPLEFRLTKQIPTQSGLGGGSGNAAGTLVLIDQMFGLELSPTELKALAADLGSDVPFFLGDGAAVCRGRGESVSEFPAAGEGSLFGEHDPRFVVIVPPIGCATPAIFSRVSFPLTSPDGPISFQETTFVNSSRWPQGIFNRLEALAIASDRGLESSGRRRPDRGGVQRVPEPARVDSRRNITLSGVSNWLAGHAADAWPDRRARGPGAAATPVRNWAMTGSGSAFFVAARDFASARLLAVRARQELEVHASVHRVLA